MCGEEESKLLKDCYLDKRNENISLLLLGKMSQLHKQQMTGFPLSIKHYGAEWGGQRMSWHSNDTSCLRDEGEEGKLSDDNECVY